MTHELMIGNWVMYNGKEYQYERQDWLNRVIITDPVLKAGIKVASDKLSPIPITPEWLEKLGFGNERTYGTVIQSNGNIDCYIDPANGKMTFYFRYKEIPDITYVHQIQNLITILNGKR